MFKSDDSIAMDAIDHAIKALRKRHLLEEGAHAPAFIALARPILSQGSEWKEKAENLELELKQCYKAQARLSEQLVTEVAESRASQALIQQNEAVTTDIQNELTQARDENGHLKVLVEEKSKALELLIGENQELRGKLEQMSDRAEKAEAENKMLIDRWMLQKMQQAECLNEANAVYKDMLDQVKMSDIEQLAMMQVDGVVRIHEEGSESYTHSSFPTLCKNKIPAHEGGCAAICFDYGSSKLISGGHNETIKIWDANTATLTRSLNGCLGSVLDLAITHDNNTLIAAASSNKLFVWDVKSGRMNHTLTGHTDKVCAVDVNHVSSRHVVSAAYDRTIKVWDLQRGYCVNTIIFYSNCNALCFSSDGRTIFSGHVDGSLRLWDVQTGKLQTEVAAHSSAITSVSVSRGGNLVLSSGRDNKHNLFDVNTLEICGSFKAVGNNVGSNWSRSCMSPDGGYVSSGSADGSVFIWSVSKGNVVSTVKEHNAAVLCCTWSGLGKPLASSDKNGVICLWG